MQAYARLVKNIQNAGKRTAYLRCKTDTLTFTARQSCRTARKREITKPHVAQKADSVIYFLYDAVRNHMLGRSKLGCIGISLYVVDSHIADFGNIFAAYGDRKGFLFQSFAAADGTIGGAHIAFYVPLYPFGLGLGIPTL